MKLRVFEMQALPLWAAILPLLTINTTYIVAVGLEHVSACIPYIYGCASVSSTGREAPESLIFRAGMVPSAVILMLLWYRCAEFLELGGQAGSKTRALKLFAVLAGLSLMLYALTLGFSEGAYPRWRRVGIIGFALSTFVAELLFVLAYRPLRRADTETAWRWLVVLCVALPLFDLGSEIGKASGIAGHAPDYIATWNAFIVASLFYVIVGRLWRRHGFVSQHRLDH